MYRCICTQSVGLEDELGRIRIAYEKLTNMINTLEKSLKPPSTSTSVAMPYVFQIKVIFRGKLLRKCQEPFKPKCGIASGVEGIVEDYWRVSSDCTLSGFEDISCDGKNISTERRVGMKVKPSMMSSFQPSRASTGHEVRLTCFR